MMRALLADRFKLKIHSETQQMAVLDLVPEKTGRLGPTLKAHPDDDPACKQQPAVSGYFSPCGAVGWMPAATSKMAGRNISLQMFADNVSGIAGKPVVDKTGLPGKYDFTLEFVGGVNSGADLKASETDATFLEAITDQMGLKLVPDKGPVEVIVMDHIERPTEN
jgi:uncharacterized protein (TIGR03435 family)